MGQTVPPLWTLTEMGTGHRVNDRQKSPGKRRSKRREFKRGKQGKSSVKKYQKAIPPVKYRFRGDSDGCKRRKGGGKTRLMEFGLFMGI